MDIRVGIRPRKNGEVTLQGVRREPGLRCCSPPGRNEACPAGLQCAQPRWRFAFSESMRLPSDELQRDKTCSARPRAYDKSRNCQGVLHQSHMRPNPSAAQLGGPGAWHERKRSMIYVCTYGITYHLFAPRTRQIKDHERRGERNSSYLHYERPATESGAEYREGLGGV